MSPGLFMGLFLLALALIVVVAFIVATCAENSRPKQITEQIDWEDRRDNEWGGK